MNEEAGNSPADDGERRRRRIEPLLPVLTADLKAAGIKANPVFHVDWSGIDDPGAMVEWKDYSYAVCLWWDPKPDEEGEDTDDGAWVVDRQWEGDVAEIHRGADLAELRARFIDAVKQGIERAGEPDT